MKAICITGNSQQHIAEISINLQAAGIPAALPSKRDSEITTSAWHELVLESHGELTKIDAIGNLWEKMAIDIFLANHKQRLWHWAEKGSLQVAGYWLNFDMGIHFLLVHTSLDEYLEAKLDSAETVSKARIDAEIANWEFHTQLLLELHDAFPHRTTLINSEKASINSLSIIENLNKKLDLEMDTSSAQPPSRKFDPVLQYLAQTLIYGLSNARGPQKKLSKTKSPENNWDMAIEAINCHLKSKYTPMITPSSTAITTAFGAAKSAIDSEASELREKVSELETDNRFLLQQLHETQEEYELHLRTMQPIRAEFGSTKVRLENILKAHPNYWECDALEISMKAPNSFKWSLTNTYLRNSKIEKLEFETTLTNHGVQLSLIKSPDSKPALIKWPGDTTSRLDMSTGQIASGQPNALNWLGPTDWDNITFLTDRIIAYCGSDSALNHFTAATGRKLSKGMHSFRDTLEKWPSILRYDAIDLFEVIQVGEYYALGIRLKNVRIGSIVWSDFQYRISTFNVANEEFGAHPRLEFPESSRHALQSWYAETTDDRGERLELRFSRPNAMDTLVWSKLAGNDQLFLTALIVSIPIQLGDLQLQHTKSGVKWNNWKSISDFMRSTLSTIHKSKTTNKEPTLEKPSTKRVAK